MQQELGLCCLKSRTEGINCPFQEMVMMKSGDTNITDEGKSKIFPKPQKMAILGQALIAQCSVTSLPRQHCCDPRAHSGFLRLETRAWSHCPERSTGPWPPPELTCLTSTPEHSRTKDKGLWEGQL